MALLFYLLVEGRGRMIRRNRLAELFWPGYTPSSGLTNLRSALHKIRDFLAPLELLQSDRFRVGVRDDLPDFWCDVWLLEGLPRQGRDSQSDLLDSRSLTRLRLPDSLSLQAWFEERYGRYEGLLKGRAERQPGPFILPADWGNSLLPIRLVDRKEETEQLRAWSANPDCHLIGLFALPGMGKSALARHFSQTLSQTPPPLLRGGEGLTHWWGDAEPGEAAWGGVIWRSLVHKPTPDQILRGWIGFLSGKRAAKQSRDADEQMTQLLALLGRKRYLLVLDSLETVLDEGDRAGHFSPGYERLGQWMERIAHGSHQSCLLLISREEPRTFAHLENTTGSVKRMRLSGLSVEAGSVLLRPYLPHAEADSLAALVEGYGGNPLALLLAEQVIIEIYGGSVQRFMQGSGLIFDDLRDVLAAHFQRLTPLEHQMLLLFARERLPLSLAEVAAQMANPQSYHSMNNALRALIRRHLVERFVGRSGEEVSPRFGVHSLIRQYFLTH